MMHISKKHRHIMITSLIMVAILIFVVMRYQQIKSELREWVRGIEYDDD